MRCRKQVEIKDPVMTKNSRGVNMCKGTCGTCQTKVCRMLGRTKE